MHGKELAFIIRNAVGRLRQGQKPLPENMPASDTECGELERTMEQNQKWVEIFGNAPSLTAWKPEQYAKNVTLTYPIPVPFDGSAVKLKFSNRYGSERVTLSKWAVVREENGSEEYSVLGEGEAVVMNAGEERETEEFAVTVRRNDRIFVQIYLADYTNLTSGVLTTGCLSGGSASEGNFIGKKPDVWKTAAVNWNYFLTDVSLKTDSRNRAVIMYGDSITAQDWPDECYRMLLSEEDNRISVIRKAVSGTRLLRQYDCNKYRSYGIRGDVRFPNECEVRGASAILIQHGINDIIHPVGTETNVFRPWSDLPSAEEMTACYQRYIGLAREKGLKVYFGTLLPIEGWRTYADFREDLRQEVNDWIRNCRDIDGVVDFDLAVRNPDNVHAFRDGFDSGDHLHPSKDAYREMGYAAFRMIREQLSEKE